VRACYIRIVATVTGNLLQIKAAERLNALSLLLCGLVI
jgi:hypothetical protein